jgi:flagellar protein FliO/FliZ
MPDTSHLILVIAVFLFAIALIALAAWGVKAFFSNGGSSSGFLRSRERRLGLVETYSLDARRKLMLVRRDDKEHLLLVGGPVDLLLETGIEGRRPLEPPLEGVIIDHNDRRSLPENYR